MKKGLILLVLTVLIAGAAFAQSSPKNFASGEISVLGLGARYERMLTNMISVGGNAYYNSFFFWEEWGVDASVRFYPFDYGALSGAFIGAGVGFHIHSDGFGIMPLVFAPLFQVIGVAITPEIGVKIDVGSRGGFYLSPGVKFPVTIGARTGWLDGILDTNSTIGIGFGIVPYIGITYGF